jgi:hypothetical protein
MISKILAGGAVVASLVGGTAGAASAATHPAAHPKVATGSVELGSPLQYEKFVALQGSGRDHGDVRYTNWTYPDTVNSGVFAPAPAAAGQPLTFTTSGGSSYGHTLNTASLTETAKSADQLNFTGTGEYGTNPATDPWTITGQVKDSAVKFTITYGSWASPAYSVTATGTIAADGSASGTATDTLGQHLTWSQSAGAWFSVLSYHAHIQWAAIQPRHHGGDAEFGFTIPKAGGSLAGVKVTVKVHDGGRGIAHDTYAHNGASYSIIGGPGITIP